MPTFSPQEVPHLVTVVQSYNLTAGTSRPDTVCRLECGHDARQSFPTNKIEITLPPVNDYTYMVLDLDATLVCTTCWRATHRRLQAGVLPSGPPAGYPWTKGRLPTEGEVNTVVLQDLLRVLQGGEPGETGSGEEYVAEQEEQDPDRVAALRAEVALVLDRYATEGFDLQYLWTR